ncbi:uncharacterized protein LOC133845078 isoform X2 [Drosophila sulfurigaster albostrigata]|uniref:uncharacterized protein LOC133845078 isoform X2 n=1 Tax=Drosophila sulfurigaster albostrigata TaxID=89887 RepID=UPI002D21AAB4|nr:uncharacterized protein LOC133845078 isoform X2 [Drosophila sulfurigaster albostrigata]
MLWSRCCQSCELTTPASLVDKTWQHMRVPHEKSPRDAIVGLLYHTGTLYVESTFSVVSSRCASKQIQKELHINSSCNSDLNLFLNNSSKAN